jgi:hypothetical protein
VEGEADGLDRAGSAECVRHLLHGILAERWRRGEWQSAMRATKGYLAGASLGIMAKVTSGLLMLGAFLTRVYLWP